MIEVTEASDGSHALHHKRRQDRESLDDFGGIGWQKQALPGKAVALKLCDGNHTTRSFFGFRISSYFFPASVVVRFVKNSVNRLLF
jgi:hypothetical protein